MSNANPSFLSGYPAAPPSCSTIDNHNGTLDNVCKKIRSFGRDIANYSPIFIVIFLYLEYGASPLYMIVLSRFCPSYILLFAPSFIFITFVILVIVWGTYQGHIRQDLDQLLLHS
jgi:hypothetical protein